MNYYFKKLGIGAISTIKSKRISDKIIVFESDDWGGIRTPNTFAANRLIGQGAYTSEPAYLAIDTLECESDFTQLFEILKKHKNEKGCNPIITTNFIMTNPDFKKIKESEFLKYYYELFLDTYNRVFGQNKIKEVIDAGIRDGLIYPQFHGREHVNIPLWLNLLQSGNKTYLDAFEEYFFGIQTLDLEKRGKNIQATYDLPENSQFVKESILDGLAIFERVFGFRSQSFIPNNYIWNQNWNKILIDNGVKFLQGVRVQTEPSNGNETKRNAINRYDGRYEKFGLVSLVRRATFEPSFSNCKGKKALEICLADIKIAFQLNQPAIVSTHRINYVSGLKVENRSQNLELLDELLFKILKKWPDVVFMNSEQMGNYYMNKNL